MPNFLYLYQHIPYYINPTALSLGNFKVDWYSLMYLLGFGVVYFLLRYRITKSEFLLDCHSCESRNPVSQFKVSTLDSRRSLSSQSGGGNDKDGENFKSQNEIQNTKYKIQNTDTLLDLMLVAFGGLLIGGRLGYVMLYNLHFYLQNPLAIISPYDITTHQFIGIYGMSYHGGLIGALVAAWIFLKKRTNPIKYQQSCPPTAEFNRAGFWQWANFVAPAIPAGYFFGRVGNFLNGELYGRATNKFWGMYFPSDPFGLLRHPSELYEAGLEGLLLFLILWKIRNNEKYKNSMLALYIIGYALARIIVEFFREPDSQVGYLMGGVTLGQLLSMGMFICGLCLIFVSRNKKNMLQLEK